MKLSVSCFMKTCLLSVFFSGSTVMHQLKPNEARRFAWDDPTGTKSISWSYMEHSGQLDLLKVSLTDSGSGLMTNFLSLSGVQTSACLHEH